MSSKNDLRDDITQTRGDLGGTVGALADKADLKKRARKAKQDAQDNVEQLTESAQRHPMRWGSLVAGVAAAIAAVGALQWRRSRRPKNRAERMWSDAKGRAKGARKDVVRSARGMTKDAKRTAKRVKNRMSR